VEKSTAAEYANVMKGAVTELTKFQPLRGGPKDAVAIDPRNVAERDQALKIFHKETGAQAAFFIVLLHYDWSMNEIKAVFSEALASSNYALRKQAFDQLNLVTWSSVDEVANLLASQPKELDDASLGAAVKFASLRGSDGSNKDVQVKSSDLYKFMFKYGTNQLFISERNTGNLIAVYKTAEPIIHIVAVSDLTVLLRQSRTVDHVVDVWVELESLQIGRAEYETASLEATAKVQKIMKVGQDPILNKQNEMNLATGKITKNYFANSPAAIDYASGPRPDAGLFKDCKDILLGPFHRLHRSR
jgi:hypothetical protein